MKEFNFRYILTDYENQTSAFSDNMQTQKVTFDGKHWDDVVCLVRIINHKF